MYSVPLRSVQMFLHAIVQVWQPMHLSRWKTIATCDRISIVVLLVPIPFLCRAASPGRGGLAYGYHGDVELERHPGERMIGIDNHEAILFIDLGDHHVL